MLLLRAGVFYCSVAVSVAQNVPAKLHGTIADAAGAAISGVEVTLSGPVTRSVRSDDSGAFILPDLPSGSVVNRMVNISVTLRDARWPKVMAATTTDIRGELDFGKIAPGKYELEVSYHGRRWTGAKEPVLREGFVTEASMGWGTALCVTPAQSK
jgi:hypothetical protein